MIVVYALGGGLGHLTRVRAALATPGCIHARGPVAIVTSSPFAADPRVVDGHEVVSVPVSLARDRTGLGRFVADAFAARAPDEVIIDAFPAGILGELTAGMIPTSASVTHLARSLRWAPYAGQLPLDPPRVDTTWVLEPLEDDHLAFLQARSAEVQPFTLVTPRETPCDRDGQPVTIEPDPEDPDRPTWLIVHAGPPDEVDELVAYALDQARHEGADPRLVLIAPAPPGGTEAADAVHRDRWSVAGAEVLDVYPAGPLVAAADRVFTAGGFNAMREAEAWPERHRPMPFARTFDDQFARVRRARPAGPA